RQRITSERAIEKKIESYNTWIILADDADLLGDFPSREIADIHHNNILIYTRVFAEPLVYIIRQLNITQGLSDRIESIKKVQLGDLEYSPQHEEYKHGGKQDTQPKAFFHRNSTGSNRVNLDIKVCNPKSTYSCERNANDSRFI